MSNISVAKGEKAIQNNAGMLLVSDVIQRTGILDAIPGFSRGSRGPIPYANKTLALLFASSMSAAAPHFNDVEHFASAPEFFSNVFGTGGSIPSEAVVRQRMNLIASTMAKDPAGFKGISNNLGRMIVPFGLKPTPLPCGKVPVDIDVTTMDESKTHKEGISWTYKHFYGYAPQMAYVGEEGYLLSTEFHTGKDHSQHCTAVDFIENAVKQALEITDAPVLLRMDGGNDAMDNYARLALLTERADFLVKRNFRGVNKLAEIMRMIPRASVMIEPRFGKTVYYGSYTKTIYCGEGVRENKSDYTTIRVVFEITVRRFNHDGQMYLEPDYEIDEYYTTLSPREFSEEEVIELYHARGTSEQFHSEVKTDLDLDKLPSGKFDTNALILHLNAVAFNALKIIERIAQEMPEGAPIHFRDTKRRRIMTIVENLIRIPALLTSHARKLTLSLGRCCPWADTFLHVHNRVRNIRLPDSA